MALREQEPDPDRLTQQINRPPARAARPPSALRLGALVAVMYFIVSGGPFGLEGLVGTVGSAWALILLVATPLLYSVPEALLVGELASMLPLEGGYYQWVKRAFGPFWGFWNGWLSWSYSLLDMAIYPVLFLQYLAYFAPGLGRLASWLLAIGMIWIATGLNLRGARAVGRASGAFVALVLTPFAVLAIIALARWHSSGGAVVAARAPSGGLPALGLLGIGLSQAIWNYSGWDNASTICGEIENAGSAYPKALIRAVPLVSIVYGLAIVPVLAVTDPSRWTDGAWPDLGAALTGPWLGAWLAAAGIASAFALFNALLLAYSRVPRVLAQDGYLPKALARTDARGVPRNAILVSAVVYTLFALIPFGGLLAGDVLLYTAALALEFAALIRLRRTEPALRGPFRVPLPVPGLVVLAALPILVIIAAVVMEVQSREIGLPGALTALALAVVGPIWFRLRKVAG